MGRKGCNMTPAFFWGGGGEKNRVGMKKDRGGVRQSVNL